MEADRKDLHVVYSITRGSNALQPKWAKAPKWLTCEDRQIPSLSLLCFLLDFLRFRTLTSLDVGKPMDLQNVFGNVNWVSPLK